MDQRNPKARTGRRSSSAMALFASALLLGSWSEPARARGAIDCDLTTKIFPADGSVGDLFGSALAVSENRLIVGAPGHNGPGLLGHIGTAYIFFRNDSGWMQQQKFLPGGLVTLAHFGASVAIDGDTAVIGCPGPGVFTIINGAAYVYHYNGTNWVLQQKLLADDGAPNDLFGAAVGIIGDDVIIGAPNHGSGAVYAFHRTDAAWLQQQAMTPASCCPYASFGSAIAISNDRALIAAQSIAPGPPGSAYVFAFDGLQWSQQQQLPTAPFDSTFGQSIALSGQLAVVGGSEGTPGIAYAHDFDETSWSLQQKMMANDSDEAYAFARAVAVSGDTILVGAYGESGAADHAGAAYVFRNGGYGWLQQRRILPPDGVNLGHFGAAIALHDQLALIGAPGAMDAGGIATGAVYAMNLDPQIDCNANGIADPCDIGQGASQDANGNGIPDECEQPQCLPTHRLLGGEIFNAEFGWAVAVDGDAALVGAPLDMEDQETWRGSAYIFGFKDSHWIVRQRLLADDGNDFDVFGATVVLQGDVAMIGAGYAAGIVPGAGAVYLFHRENGVWIQQQKLFASDGASSDSFGYSLSASENKLLVGAMEADEAGNDAGAVYAFAFNGTRWEQQQKILAPDAVADLYFGARVAIWGDDAIIGTESDQDASRAAYVYHFDGSTWVLQQKLVPTAESTENFWGSSVAILDDLIVVGGLSLSYGSSDTPGSASIYRFDGSKWGFQQRIVGKGLTTPAAFGWAVALAGDTVLVGAPHASTHGDQSGEAYKFVFDGVQWNQEQAMFPPEGSSHDQFGLSIAISGDRAIIGSPYDDGYEADSGSAYIFDGITDADCNGNGAPDYCDIFTGASQDLNHNGVPDECEIAACAADIAPPDGDGTVNVDDLLAVINGWGPCGTGACPADIAPPGPPQGDGIVNVDDLLAVINAWGPCP